MSDLSIEELPPRRYAGMVEKVRYTFTATTKIVITYKLETPGGTRRLEEVFLISAPPSSTFHYRTTTGLGRVADILRIRGMSLAEAQIAGGLKALPGLLEDTTLGVITRNQRLHGFDCPIVVRVEKP